MPELGGRGHDPRPPTKEQSLHRIALALEYIGRCLTRPPVGFEVDVTAYKVNSGDHWIMNPKVKLQVVITDNGIAIVTAVVVDSKGNPPSPAPTYVPGSVAWTSDNDAVLTFASDPGQPDGLRALGNPMGLGAASPIITAQLENGDGSPGDTISGTGDPITVTGRDRKSTRLNSS